MPGGDWIDTLAAGGKPVGIGLVALAAVRLFMFVFHWLAGRYDTRQDRLEKREERVDASYDARLTQLEQQGEAARERISILEEAVNILATELRQHDPANSKLSEVAKMLRRAVPMPPPSAGLDDLMRKIK